MPGVKWSEDERERNGRGSDKVMNGGGYKKAIDGRGCERCEGLDSIG